MSKEYLKNCTLLLVEDNRSLADTVIDFLETSGFQVDYASNGRIGYNLLEENPYDVVILDVAMPKMDGITLCKEIREHFQLDVPVIMLTARDQLSDKLTGFGSGADDYLVKPFDLPELEARVVSLIRRRRGGVESQRMEVGDLIYDLTTQQVTRQGKPIELTPTGLGILRVLMRESPKVVSRVQLEQELWGDGLPDTDALRSHLYNLRKAVDKPFEVKLIHTLPGLGFKLVE